MDNIVVPRKSDKVVMKIKFGNANENQWLELNSLRAKYRDELYIMFGEELTEDECDFNGMPYEFPIETTLTVKAFNDTLEPTPNVPLNELLEDLQDIRDDKFNDKPTIRNGKNWLNN